MSHSDDIIERLKMLKPAFRDLGLKRVRVFGSVARGSAGPASDVDLLVDFETFPNLLDMGGVLMDLERRLGISVDLVTPETRL